MDSVDSAIAKPSGFYYIGANTTGNDRFYAYAPVLVLRRYGGGGSALIIGLATDRQTIVGKVINE